MVGQNWTLSIRLLLSQSLHLLRDYDMIDVFYTIIAQGAAKIYYKSKFDFQEKDVKRFQKTKLA